MADNIEVKIIAFEKESAILESIDIDTVSLLFKWPSQQLPALSRIGDHFILELHATKEEEKIPAAVANFNTIEHHKKHKLLEALIN